MERARRSRRRGGFGVAGLIGDVVVEGVVDSLRTLLTGREVGKVCSPDLMTSIKASVVASMQGKEKGVSFDFFFCL